jgi:hypothetical protein
MKTMLTIVSTLILIYAIVPLRVCAQARATAIVRATVLLSVSIELKKSITTITKDETFPLTMNLRGTDNILVVVDSKNVKSVNIFQLTTEKPTMVIIPSSLQAGKTSITYLSS